VHPGYGFLSENGAFARMCADAGIVFIGPAPETLDILGSKTSALALAESAGINVLPGTREATSIEEATSFFRSLGGGGAVMLKALAGGGGRGMRPVTALEDLPAAFERCASEARSTFGSGDLYVEEFYRRARHVEVQIVGDGSGRVSHLWDRECSLQRQRQKLIEIAPAPNLPDEMRTALLAAAVRIGESARYRGLGTVEFLINAAPGAEAAFSFIEVNPRLQVEHTVTEEVLGLDLVRIQIEIASGKTLEDLELGQNQVPQPRGYAVQCRVNLETVGADGTVRAAGGRIVAYDPPTGAGVRVDGYGYSGYETNARYDSLLAKVIAHIPSGGLAAALAKARRALTEFRIAGPETNIPFLEVLLAHPAVLSGETHTRLVEEELDDLARQARDPLPRRYFETTDGQARPDLAPDALAIPKGMLGVTAPMLGTIVSIAATAGEPVRADQILLVIEAMKMEHVITATAAGIVREIHGAVGDMVQEGQLLALVEPGDAAGAAAQCEAVVDPDTIRSDLEAVLERHRLKLDPARPQAVARRRKTGQRTARENIEAIADADSFLEYGALTVAARRARHSLDELVRETPADGLVSGVARVNGEWFEDDAARCTVIAYDYTVLAGTQGVHNHKKADRLIELAHRWRLPVIIFCEGGGGRPGDTEGGGFVRMFENWGRLSGQAPLIGIASGRCFAGNAAMLGCCDVIIATRDATIGMGGPAMIEGGGLGVFRAEEVGPVAVQEGNGVIDIVVEDEAEAAEMAKKYLSYFQGVKADWSAPDQRLLRQRVPENRRRSYDMRELIRTLADDDSILELRPNFGTTMVTALIRIEGRPFGLFANNPQMLGGAIDSDGSDKAARLMQICEAFDIPLISLSDTPGMMVGPEVEKTALVRHCSRLFLIGANLTVPVFSVVIRKSYGLGAIAMTGGSYQASVFAVAWPTGEFGGMGLEGSVRLGYRKELEAIKDAAQRNARFEELLAQAYEAGGALARANTFRIDDVIDPADTRRWIIDGIRSLPAAKPRSHKKLRWIDAR
jgi:acetyl-CoA carboxylase carboxyltransferase component/biotin carboxylase